MLKGSGRKNRIWRGSTCLLALMGTFGMLTGCARTEGQEENIVLIEKEAEEIVYEMAVVTVADVVKTEKVKCVYQQVNDEQVSFSTGGKRIDKVYVEKGDTVKKGQLLATLDTGNAADTMEKLEYQIARNELTLEYLETNQNNELSTIWLNFMYNSGGSESAKKATEANAEQILQRYEYSREDCEDAIALDKKELELLQKEVKQASVYAGMDGTVSFVQSDLEGSASIEGEVIIRIIDSTECLFAVEDVKYAEYFAADTIVSMSISSGSGAGSYELVPYRMEEWEDKLLFTIAQEDDANIDVGTMGLMKVVLDERKQVLSVPAKAVHVADGRSYVYVLGADNVREVKWIETGLVGDTDAEVLSGLTEGEKVILQ